MLDPRAEEQNTRHAWAYFSHPLPHLQASDLVCYRLFSFHIMICEIVSIRHCCIWWRMDAWQRLL